MSLLGKVKDTYGYPTVKVLYKEILINRKPIPKVIPATLPSFSTYYTDPITRITEIYTIFDMSELLDKIVP